MAEEPTTEPMATEPAAPKEPAKEDEIDVDAIMAELKAVGKTTPESVQGMYTASKESGNLANMVGDLKAEIQSLKANRATPQVSQDPYAEEPSSVDLGHLIDSRLETGLNKFWTKMQQSQNEAYQQSMQDLSTVQADKYYPHVKDIFDEHLRSPNVQMSISTGTSSYSKEYQRVKDKYTDKLLERAGKTIEQLGKGVKPSAPHMESGSPSVPVTPESDEIKAKKKKIVDSATGSDDDIDKILDLMLPEGDPITKTY
jgi:hypothetical protein